MPPPRRETDEINPAGNSASVRTRRIREFARDVLGFEEFRPGQERAMQAVLSAWESAGQSEAAGKSKLRSWLD